jgi:hypothetical protein
VLDASTFFIATMIRRVHARPLRRISHSAQTVLRLSHSSAFEMTQRVTCNAAALMVGAITSTTLAAQTTPARSSDWLYLWTASSDTTQPDFLTVLDVRPQASRYGALVTTVAVPGRRNRPHHTEHTLANDRQLFANGFATGRTFVFDLSQPTRPRIAAEFGDVDGLMHPHTFVRLPNDNILATFQMQHASGTNTSRTLPGGIAELTTQGRVVRSASAAGAGVDTAIRPYSAAVFPTIDRVLTTTSDMGRGPERNALQLWRLSDFTLLSTFDLPNGPLGNEGALTAEPRVLADGRSALVSTFNCGVYYVTKLNTPKPESRLVASFPQKEDTNCALPVVVGSYYLITVPAWSAVVSLDIRDPARPREVSRVTFGADDVPHWIALEPNGRRVVVTGYRSLQHRVTLLTFDARTGRLAIDSRFREIGATTPGFRFTDKEWPHGGRAAGIPHGAVFSR